MSGASSHRQAVDAAWAAYGDDRTIAAADEVSANVSTNRVYRLHLDDGSTVISKVSSYGSYFLFVEDHEQLNRCAGLLHATRFTGMLADIWSREGRIFTWYDQHMWAVFYDDVPRRDSLPRILSVKQIANLATEMAEFHLACAEIAPLLPNASKTIKSDAIHLLDLLESPFAPRNFELPPESIGVLGPTTIGAHGVWVNDADIAILKVPATHLPTVKFGLGGPVRRGQWTIALGNPYGLSVGGDINLNDHSTCASVIRSEMALASLAIFFNAVISRCSVMLTSGSFPLPIILRWILNEVCTTASILPWPKRSME